MKKNRSNLVEKALGVVLPEDYALFLEQYGFMTIDGMEIFGYSEQVKDIDEIPCVIGATRRYRPLYGLKDDQIVLAVTDFEEVLIVLDTSSGAVLETGFTGQKRIADSFAQWFELLSTGQAG
ncbi:MAG: SMI1/KNR4 family protein [Desulfotignum sp.]|nr:SMI1/KNR4 family protein [Desulfotignum sp.]MCF8089610.1 SMI1/KNR4 family protein [Desulfotignum sp.]